jgi:hypothetical protein
MSIWYRQTVDGEVTDERQIAAHFEGQTDAELLTAKFKGAREKGWTVRRTGPDSFTATKKRWAAAVECVREFWTAD